MTKTITLSMPEELVRRAKVLAAQRDTSVSALIGELLEQLVGDIADYGQEWAAEEELMSTGIGMHIGDIARSRDELHQR